MNANIVGYACIIDRSNGKSEIKEKIVSQVELNIPTYNKDNLPKELSFDNSSQTWKQKSLMRRIRLGCKYRPRCNC